MFQQSSHINCDCTVVHKRRQTVDSYGRFLSSIESRLVHQVVPLYSSFYFLFHVVFLSRKSFFYFR